MRRVWAAVGLVWLPVGALVGMWAPWSQRLPARVATHWSGWGAADGFTSAAGAWAAVLTLGVLAGLAGVAAAVLVRRDLSAGDLEASVAARRASGARALLLAAGATAGGAAGLWAAIAGATLADPADARLGWRFLFFIIGLAWAFAVGAVLGRPVRPVVPLTTAVDPLELGPTERAAFSTTLHAPFLLGVVLAATAVATAVAAFLQPALWPVVAALVVTASLFGRIRVTADRRGLRLTAGLAGVPIKHIPLADIATVEVAEINPMEWGGWGYRVTPGRSALILRGGPGLVTYLRDGRRFAVTMGDPRVPAALLTALQIRAQG